MSGNAHAFHLPSDAMGERLFKALAARFTTRRESAEPRREVYFDTFDWRVFLDGGTLSLREDGTGVTLSWRTVDGRLRHRLKGVAHPAFARDLPRGPLREELAARIDVRRLLPIVEVRLTGRTVSAVDERAKTVARVSVERGTARLPGEVGREAELPPTLSVVAVRGYEEHAGEIARYVAERFAPTAVPACELTRALNALGREPGDVPPKLPWQLRRGQRADEATKTILLALLETMQRNEDGMRRDLDTEFLHDFRVAVRRTRSALGQIKQVLPPVVVERFRGEFSWLGDLTGPLRDLDVYLLRLPEYRAMLTDVEGDELEPLESFLRRRHADERARLIAGLDSPRYSRLVEDWREFLQRPTTDADGPPSAALPVEQVAAERIRAVRLKVVERGRKIGPGTRAAKLHRLRIDCKKLRYLLEFFGALFDERAIGVLVKRLKKLQDNLGDFNDLEVQQESLRRFPSEMAADAAIPESTLLAMGRLVERLARRQAELRGKLGATFARFDTLEVRARFDGLFGVEVPGDGTEP